MNFNSYMKHEIEKALFIETNKDITLNTKGNPVLRKGEYPLLPEDVVNLAQTGLDSIPAGAIINGMIYITACDPEFKYNEVYINFLRSVEGIESYIIYNIDNNKTGDIKKAIIYSTALYSLFPEKEYGMNRCYLLMEYYDRTNLEIIEYEIISSLEKLTLEYPDFAPPNYYLGEYHADKDMDRAKVYLRKCLEDPSTREGAGKLLDKIKNTEDYDKAVGYVKEGRGYEALKILIPYLENNPDSLDALYYTAVGYRQIEDHHKALYYLDELLNHGERLEVYSEIALNLAGINEFEAAIEYFKKALKIKPDDSGIICNIGVCHLNLGEADEAVKAFELANRINPKDEIALKWLKEIKRGI